MKHAYFLYTGYGKTKLCLDKIINTIKRPRTLLISTKKIVESSWPAEIDKWYPGRLTYAYLHGGVKEKDRQQILNTDYDILGVSVDMLDWYVRNSTSINKKSYTKHGIKYHHDTNELIERFDMLIIDESSLFKNSNTERFKILKQWAHKVKNVMILSATPTPRSIENIWSQIYLLDGGQRLGTSITKFRQNYGIAVPLPNGHNRYMYTQAAIDEVLKLVKDITTSIPNPPAPLFPEPTIKKIMITPDSDTLEYLREIKKKFIIQFEDIQLKAFSEIQLRQVISQISSGQIYTHDGVRMINNSKMKALKSILQNIHTPVLITYFYRFDLEALLTLPGARLLDTDRDFKDWNNNLIPIGIISPFSAAHGLNLQASECRDIIWYSPIDDTEKWIQLNARVIRRGQRYSVTIRVLITKESYDDAIFKMCRVKDNVQYNNLVQLQGDLYD